MRDHRLDFRSRVLGVVGSAHRHTHIHTASAHTQECTHMARKTNRLEARKLEAARAGVDHVGKSLAELKALPDAPVQPAPTRSPRKPERLVECAKATPCDRKFLGANGANNHVCKRVSMGEITPAQVTQLPEHTDETQRNPEYHVSGGSAKQIGGSVAGDPSMHVSDGLAWVFDRAGRRMRESAVAARAREIAATRVGDLPKLERKYGVEFTLTATRS